MQITRPQVLRALPTVAANLLALVCALALGWPIVTLFLLFILETWMMLALNSVRVALHPEGGIMEAVPLFVMPTLFVAIQLVAAILILDSKRYGMQASGDLIVDFLRYIGSLGLAWPLAMIAVVRVADIVREISQGKTDQGESFIRIFVMIALFIFALGPTSVMAGEQWWALVALVLIKAGFEIWWLEQVRAQEIMVAQYEKERREYLATLDPRGRGTWPTPPPPVNRA